MLRVRDDKGSGVKVVNAGTFDDLLEKGCAKLKLSTSLRVTLITECGVDVEDDDGVQYATAEKTIIIFKQHDQNDAISMPPHSFTEHKTKTKSELNADKYELSAKTELYEETNESLEANLALNMKLIAIDMNLELENKNGLTIFKLPMELTNENSKDKLKSFELGAIQLDKDHRYILLTGMTGVGKSMFLNFIVNYVYGVNYKDSFRFKLIIESEEIGERDKGASLSQSQSMTSWVTSYTFNWQEGFRIPYSLTIVDTPGFGDTRGIKYDQIIVDQIKHLFENKKICPTQELSCIGFLIQASQARITAEQKYIFDQVLGIFGSDIKDNIFIIFTFCDGQPPPALAVIKSNEIPFAEGCTFKFNNSVVYASNDNKFSEHTWEFVFDNFEAYFEALGKTTPVSLELTKEVLEERAQLRSILSSLQEQILKEIDNLEEIENETLKLEQLEHDIEANKGHTQKIPAIKYEREHCKYDQKNCSVCQRTCHTESAWKKGYRFVDKFLKKIDTKKTQILEDVTKAITTTPVETVASTDTATAEKTVTETVMQDTGAKSISDTMSEKTATSMPQKMSIILPIALPIAGTVFESLGEVMDSCGICGCLIADHITENYIYVRHSYEKEITINDIFEKYNVAVNAKNATKIVLKNMLSKYQERKKQLMTYILRANRCSKRLEEIAIRKYSPTNYQFVEHLITLEQNSSNINKTRRVQQLRHLKDIYELLSISDEDFDAIMCKKISEYEEMIRTKIENITDE